MALVATVLLSLLPIYFQKTNPDSDLVKSSQQGMDAISFQFLRLDSGKLEFSWLKPAQPGTYVALVMQDPPFDSVWEGAAEEIVKQVSLLTPMPGQKLCVLFGQDRAELQKKLELVRSLQALPDDISCQ